MNFLDNTSTTGHRAPTRGAANRYYGKYAGIVVDNVAQQGGAHRGEIKVKVPGILEQTPDGSDNQPLEIVAAPSFLPGFFFVPEAEDQVWVEFVAGDINFPIWTGVWYPEDAPPTDSDGEAPDEHKKIIRTPSGQVIHLDDTEGSEKTVIRDETNANTVTMDKDGINIEFAPDADTTSTVTLDKDGVTIEFAPGGDTSTITIDKNGVTLTLGKSTLTLKSDSIELKATDIKLTAESKITLKAPDVAAQVDNAMDVS
jgi:hypothetical protein